MKLFPKAIGIVATTAMVGYGIYQFTQPATLDTGKTERLIERNLARAGLPGQVKCPKAEFKIGEPIHCDVSLTGVGETTVRVIPTTQTDANIHYDDILLRQHMKSHVRDVLADYEVAEVNCPQSRLLTEGSVECVARLDDGRDVHVQLIRVEDHKIGFAINRTELDKPVAAN